MQPICNSAAVSRGKPLNPTGGRLPYRQSRLLACLRLLTVPGASTSCVASGNRLETREKPANSPPDTPASNPTSAHSTSGEGS